MKYDFNHFQNKLYSRAWLSALPLVVMVIIDEENRYKTLHGESAVVQLMVTNNAVLLSGYLTWLSYVIYKITMIIAASLKFSEILAATFSATWFGLKQFRHSKDHTITDRDNHSKHMKKPKFYLASFIRSFA